MHAKFTLTCAISLSSLRQMLLQPLPLPPLLVLLLPLLLLPLLLLPAGTAVQTADPPSGGRCNPPRCPVEPPS